MSARRKTYIGDGVYAEYDGFGVKLSAPRLYGEHWIYLEPEMLADLYAWYLDKRDARSLSTFPYAVCRCGHTAAQHVGGGADVDQCWQRDCNCKMFEEKK